MAELFSATPLRCSAGSANIRPLRCTQYRNEARDEKPAGRFFNWLLNGNVKKEVDETKKSLHNLVSLLLTQQRSKRR
ncbi:hypothetical protein, partial [Paraburkholderia sp.]|uniref:hypothetical protein n=1 Tax=Paraburkholderia sp. TaxID=1926495 RepID=UPI00286F6FE1